MVNFLNGGVTMNDKYYDILIKDLQIEDEVERLRIVNNRIDEIIRTTSNPQEVIEALICSFEGRNNTSTTISILAIAYAMSIGGISLLATEFTRTFFGIILIILTISIACLAFKYLDKDQKKAFVLTALKIRYEKMKSIPDSDNDRENQFEENEEYDQEYIVRVKKK